MYTATQKRGSKVFAAILALGLTSGLASSCSPEYVEIAVYVPSHLNPQAIRLVKFSAGKEVDRLDRGVGTMQVVHADKQNIFKFGLKIPSEPLQLLIQAAAGSEVIAQDTEEVGSSSIGILALTRECIRRVAYQAIVESCPTETPVDPGSASIDGGASDTNDAGTNGKGTGDASDANGPGQADVWAPPACAALDAGPTPAAVVEPAMVSAECRRYCAAMTANCNEIYPSETHCLVACERAGWPAGTTLSGANEDTIGCRTSRAERTSPDPVYQFALCGYAAPRSAGACGNLCNVYCRLGAILCGPYFPPMNDCLMSCNAKDKQLRDRNDSTTIHRYMACRFDHLEAAFFDQRHCSLAGPNDCGECGEWTSPIPLPQPPR